MTEHFTLSLRQRPETRVGHCLNKDNSGSNSGSLIPLGRVPKDCRFIIFFKKNA